MLSINLYTLPRCGFELCGLIGDSERIDDISEVSRHDHGKVREILIDTVIRDTILREIVRSDFLTSVSRPDL